MPAAVVDDVGLLTTVPTLVCKLLESPGRTVVAARELEHLSTRVECTRTPSDIASAGSWTNLVHQDRLTVLYDEAIDDPGEWSQAGELRRVGRTADLIPPLPLRACRLRAGPPQEYRGLAEAIDKGADETEQSWRHSGPTSITHVLWTGASPRVVALAALGLCSTCRSGCRARRTYGPSSGCRTRPDRLSIRGWG